VKFMLFVSVGFVAGRRNLVGDTPAGISRATRQTLYSGEKDGVQSSVDAALFINRLRQVVDELYDQLKGGGKHLLLSDQFRHHYRASQGIFSRPCGI
jgi:hypothetical protein